MSLKELLKSESTTIATVASYLDGLDHDARVKEMYAMGRKLQIRLWDLAAASPPIGAEYFVPKSAGPLKEVIHYGRNTLPLFTRFQKRFCRPADGGDGLFGYNEGTTRALIGPGYFVAHDTASNPAWHDRGAFVVDYFMVPDGQVVNGWPKVIPNTKRLQMFVFKNTRDFMRRVSNHVSVGKAYKNEKELGAYFMLCREP